MLPHAKRIALLGFVVALVGCQPRVREYNIKGAVVALDTSAKTVELDHEAIPGAMRAMRMTYPVADAKLLEGLKVGDSVRGVIRVERQSYAITSLQKR